MRSGDEMNRHAAAVVVALSIVLSGVPASAHRLDEYLQAMRVDVRADGIVVELDLTPGANLAADIIAALDRNGDGEIGQDEADSHVTGVLNSLDVKIDGRSAALTKTRQDFPALEELLDGAAVIRLMFVADIEHAGGTHHLVVRNGYRPDVGVYLANALHPGSGAITIGRQVRDPQQRTLSIEYTVARLALTRAAVSWTALAAVLIGVSAWRRRPHGLDW